MKNLWVVITTINSPTTAILKFIELSRTEGFTVLVVGDTKTPEMYAELDCEFLPIERQHHLYGDFSLEVPEKHYCRKNVGYLYAIERGAEFIFDTDDDNIPFPDFMARLADSETTELLASATGFTNVYMRFTQEKVWPRGLPLDHINDSGVPAKAGASYNAPIKQFLADREPDVDAIYRLTDNRQVFFHREAKAVALSSGTWCPFNSQATLFAPRTFDFLYLPCEVPFRMTDIWRSFVAQACLWEAGDLVSFHSPLVEQFRNEHDFFEDFLDEIKGYEYNKRICHSLESDGFLKSKTPGMQMLACYDKLLELKVVTAHELDLLSAWNAELAKAREKRSVQTP